MTKIFKFKNLLVTENFQLDFWAVWRNLTFHLWTYIFTFHLRKILNITILKIYIAKFSFRQNALDEFKPMTLVLDIKKFEKVWEN